MKFKIILLLPVLLQAIIEQCSASGDHTQDHKVTKPNIILINIDGMGWRDVGFMGSEYYETPNIYALSTQGVVFTNAYATAANCAPSRACLMSGQWSPRHGIYTVENSDNILKITKRLPGYRRFPHLPLIPPLSD